MEIIIVVLPLVFLMVVAYRGFSVILFAPVAALLAVLLTNPSWVPAFFSGIFMEKLSGFVKLYFPVFLLGAVFGKVIELSGFAKSIARSIIKVFGEDKAIFVIVFTGAVLTYGGVSLFVVAFALYPFAAELFKATDIPKRLIPGTIALGAFTFTMDALPGSPQIQNIIPTTFFNTDTWAAPWLGLIGGLFVFGVGMWYLNRRRKKAVLAGEGYGKDHINEPDELGDVDLPNVWLALLPLILVATCNAIFTVWITGYTNKTFDFAAIGIKGVAPIEIPKVTAVWAVEGALFVGITSVIIFAFKRVKTNIKNGLQLSVAGALLATLNTASEYGFGGVIAALPGFASINNKLSSVIRDPLVNEAVTTTTLSGITGSASGGMSIALAAMSEIYIAKAEELGIGREVLHRVAAMASGGMDTLPHNGAVITLLAITGLTHRQSYIDIFAMTIIKTIAVFVVIGIYYLTGLT
ncbi:MAG: GntP family permease [Chitinophagaceae bacterium]|nr:GntP family permease [Chitinophagaceae bacterium]